MIINVYLYLGGDNFYVYRLITFAEFAEIFSKVSLTILNIQFFVFATMSI